MADGREKSVEAIKEAVASGAHSIWVTVDTTIVRFSPGWS